MNSTIQALLDLQSEDLEVLSLTRELDKLKSRISQCCEEKENFQKDITKIEEGIQYQVSQKALSENALAKEQSQLDSLKQGLKEARNNKEYTTLNSQIKLKENDVSKIEEEVLKIMEVVEGYQQQKTQIHQNIEKNDAQIEELEASIADDVRELESGISEHKELRDKCATQLETNLCQEYERLFQKYEGEAICTFEDLACTGCCMTLSSSYANKLSVGKELVRCPNCGRLLLTKR